VETFLAVFIPLVLLWGVYRVGRVLNHCSGVRVVTGGSVFAAILATWPLLIGFILFAEGDPRRQEVTEFLLATGVTVSFLLLWRNLSRSGHVAISIGALTVQLLLAIPALPLTGVLLFGFHSLFFA